MYAHVVLLKHIRSYIHYSEMEAGVFLLTTTVSLPWFYWQFPSAQNGDIEARLCADEVASNEGVAVNQLQLFVQ